MILMSMHDYNTEMQPAPVNLQRGAAPNIILTAKYNTDISL